MALQIIVDGYNLIGSQKGLRGDLEGKRYRLIQALQKYREKKGYEVMVVFDGWRSGWLAQVQQQSGGITVIFSQQGERADDVIKKLAKQFGSGCVVVTSDREVRRVAERSSAVAIYAGEFNNKLSRLDDPGYTNENGLAGEDALDELRQPNYYKKGNPRKLSKTERKRREVLKKL